MGIEVISGCVFGVWVGARHALEPDHLAAVSALVADRPSARSGALLGAAWGLGHTLSLIVAGVALLGLRAELPGSAEKGAELLVAAMLIWLGARNLVRAVTAGRGPLLVHSHGPRVHHHHAAVANHVHLGPWPLAMQPLLIGVVHGLAGSGALTALAMSGMPTTGSAVVFMALFGLGSVAGMAVISGIAGASLHRLVDGPRSQTWLTVGTGALSLTVGLLWAGAALP